MSIILSSIKKRESCQYITGVRNSLTRFRQRNGTHIFLSNNEFSLLE